jgi:hypothetical protein
VVPDRIALTVWPLLIEADQMTRFNREFTRAGAAQAHNREHSYNLFERVAPVRPHRNRRARTREDTAWLAIRI